MPVFNNILTASAEDLVKIFYKFQKEHSAVSADEKLEKLARNFRMRSAQLLLATGFNPHLNELPEILPILGYEKIDELFNDRNEQFINDVYKRINLENILKIYNFVCDYPETLRIMQYLVENRLHNIETRIEETVNSTLIEKYKAEIKAIYLDRIADIDFAEKRLNKMDSGFRALVNEVSIITESKIIPAGDIFFRDTILPEEKRKLINRGLVPPDLIQARLQDENISQRERKMLLDYLQMKKPKN